VLAGVVRLLSEAASVHACFVYLLDRGGKRLVLRAASSPYAHLVGAVELRKGEGLAWWALEHREPAFIRENALEDPRVKYVPELEEEHFQSLVAIPVHGRRSDPIGVITLDTEAPREFADAEVELLVSGAWLLAGAIENARLYEEMRNRVVELEGLTELAEVVVGAETADALAGEVAERARALLRAEVTAVYLLDPTEERLRLAAAAPPDSPAAPQTFGLAELGPELGRSGRTARVSVSLVADGELLGALVATGTREVDLARAVANQAALGLKKIQVLERLTEKNLIKDFFDDLTTRRASPAALEARASRVGCDLGQRHVVVFAEAAGPELERVLKGAARGTLIDRRERVVRALAPVPAAGADTLIAALRDAHAASALDVAVGLSGPCASPDELAEGFEQARHALLGAAVLRREPAVTTYDELGPYRYLLRIALDAGPHDPTIEAVTRIAAYDRERSASLLATLEEFMTRRGSISGTSEALFVHPNTLRQRLRRISEISGIDLRRDDWLTVEIALKIVRLRDALVS
jgi:sugar diacid utilization regulator